MASLMKYIYIVLGLYVADAIISLAFLSTMVAFLHTAGAGPFNVDFPAGQTFRMAGEPLKLLTNHGHTTNGAGGTAVVIVGFGGLIALIMEHKSRKKYGKSSAAFLPWVIFVVLSWLLVLTALIYTYVLQSRTGKQVIDLTDLSQNPYPAKYPLDSWTPENWYKEVLNLPLADDKDRVIIAYVLRIMRGWKYNLIAFFLVGFVLSCLAVAELLRSRKQGAKYGRTPQYVDHK
ncbi:hypothetical protein QBC34DRAFT_69667 [Podospora aff. communis PSN243]|uniref:Uncharacterized protein n=1 Tax=Podospora aff. communis PSN243 TaxID=3040156 RepID=A0AAV9H399_9PEZI|nr:hypothetical protein QBC34DRAFT_69667 [Podospora aff. communis PSN243]